MIVLVVSILSQFFSSLHVVSSKVVWAWEQLFCSVRLTFTYSEPISEGFGIESRQGFVVASVTVVQCFVVVTDYQPSEIRCKIWVAKIIRFL